MKLKRHALAGLVLAVLLLGLVIGSVSASTGATQRHLVVFAGDYAVDSTYAVGGGYAVLCNYAVLDGYAVTCNDAVAHDYAVSLVEAAGGTVVADLLAQIGVLTVDSSNSLFAQLLSAYAVVDEVGADFAWQGAPPPAPGGGPVVHADPLEALQWDMEMIRAPQAHAVT